MISPKLFAVAFFDDCLLCPGRILFTAVSIMTKLSTESALEISAWTRKGIVSNAKNFAYVAEIDKLNLLLWAIVRNMATLTAVLALDVLVVSSANE